MTNHVRFDRSRRLIVPASDSVAVSHDDQRHRDESAGYVHDDCSQAPMVMKRVERAEPGPGDKRDTESHLTQTASTHSGQSTRVCGRHSSALISPIGAVVTDTGLTFSIAPVNLLAQPFRLRCTTCPWQATVTGPAEIRQQADRHALAHEVNPEPVPARLPSWLVRRKGNV